MRGSAPAQRCARPAHVLKKSDQKAIPIVQCEIEVDRLGICPKLRISNHPARKEGKMKKDHPSTSPQFLHRLLIRSFLPPSGHFLFYGAVGEIVEVFVASWVQYLFELVFP